MEIELVWNKYISRVFQGDIFTKHLRKAIILAFHKNNAEARL